MTDIWINGFDQGAPRTVERQLCLMRDAAQRLVKAAELGDQKLIADGIRGVNQATNDTDLLLSGIVRGRAGK